MFYEDKYRNGSTTGERRKVRNVTFTEGKQVLCAINCCHQSSWTAHLGQDSRFLSGGGTEAKNGSHALGSLTYIGTRQPLSPSLLLFLRGIASFGETFAVNADGTRMFLCWYLCKFLAFPQGVKMLGISAEMQFLMPLVLRLLSKAKHRERKIATTQFWQGKKNAANRHVHYWWASPRWKWHRNGFPTSEPEANWTSQFLN